MSESTGIIDSHTYMQSLQADLEPPAVSSRSVRDVRDGARRRRRDPARHGYDASCTRDVVVNAAGLDAPAARSATARQHRGVRFRGRTTRRVTTTLTTASRRSAGSSIRSRSPAGSAFTSRSISPDKRVSDPTSCGSRSIDYSFDEHNREQFVAAIRRYFPGVEPERLHPAYTGVRPKISGPSEPAADFAILGPAEHGARGLVHLLGIESPGLTASLAVAERVVVRSRNRR